MRILQFLLLFLIFIHIGLSLQIFQEQSFLLQFEKWTKKYVKYYPTDQITVYRLGIFIRNLEKISKHNQRYVLGQYRYTLEANQFADLTPQQFLHKFGTIKRHQPNIKQAQMTLSCNSTIIDAPNPPASVDWSSKAVNKPQSQGQCGSNWAFIAVQAVEGLYALKKGTLLKLSQQQLIDCSGDYGNQGCSGGYMDQAFWYIIDYGIATNQSYPYKAKQSNCRYIPSMRTTSFSKCAKVPSGNYSKLLSAIVQQPTSVTVNSIDFQLYSGGIYDGNCTSQLDRGMLLVGYGIQNGIKYWKLKNTLGTKWGIKGYMLLQKIQKDGQGKCGIQLAASVPQSII